MTKVLECNCNHKFQDELYGKQRRLHNISNDGKKAYCTVCSESARRNKCIKFVPVNPVWGMTQSQQECKRKSKSI